MKKLVRKIVPSTPDVIEKVLKKELRGCRNVLDLGCGENSPLRLLKGDPDFARLHSVGVDIFSPYILKNINEKKIHSEYLNMNIFDIDFPEKSFDCVILFDVIEHFNRQDFLNFLPKLEKIGKKIIVITPNGYIDQDEYDGNPYQVHRSGWTTEDFGKLGFTCYGLSGLKGLKKFQIRPRTLNTLVADISQMFMYNRPKMTFHIIALKHTSS